MVKDRVEGGYFLALFPEGEDPEEVSKLKTVAIHVPAEEVALLKEHFPERRGLRVQFKERGGDLPLFEFWLIPLGGQDLQQHIVQSLDQGLMALDGRNRLVLANPKITHLLGLSSEGELLGDGWRRALPEELMSRLEEHLGGEAFSFEATLRGIPVMVNGVPWKWAEGRQGTIVIFMDISPFKTKERELIVKVQELEDTKRAMLNLLEEMEETKRKLEWLSITDDLTGLFNRRHFYRILAKEMEIAEKYSLPLSLIVMDLDDFKDYNDTYGHVEGDKALRRSAEVLQSCIRRETDSAYRLGGDEFAVIAPGSTLEQAAKIAERVQGALEGLSLSLGIAQFSRGMDTDSFISQADKRMYEGKQRKKAGSY